MLETIKENTTIQFFFAFVLGNNQQGLVLFLQTYQTLAWVDTVF